jgi:amino-acid N-acetyltransferase
VMIYSDAYQKVRPATHADVDELYLLIHRAIEEEQLIERSRPEIQAAIGDYIVIEIDGNVVGCVAVHPHPESDRAELACLYVKRGHTGQGYGSTLVEAAVTRARHLGCTVLLALSTQAAGYLEREGFSRSQDLDLLPPERREKWSRNGRNALLLVKHLL